MLELERPPMRMIAPGDPIPPRPSSMPFRYGAFEPDGSFRSLVTGQQDPDAPGVGYLIGGVHCERDRWIELLSPPFADRGPLWAFSARGELVVGRRDAAVLEFRDALSNRVTRTLELPLSVLPLSDEDWENVPEVQDQGRREAVRGGRLHAVGRPEAACPLDGMRPASFPVVRTVLADEEGRTWVEATAPGGGHSLLVVDARGDVIARGEIPARDPRVAPFVRGGRLYLAAVDALGVQSVEVYEVRCDGCSSR